MKLRGENFGSGSKNCIDVPLKFIVSLLNIIFIDIIAIVGPKPPFLSRKACRGPVFSIRLASPKLIFWCSMRALTFIFMYFILGTKSFTS